jgi:enoyl-CoA hydratase
MKEYNNLKISFLNNIQRITIARPQVLNALNLQTLAELQQAVQEAYQNFEIKGMIITGEGEKAFVAGADIKELSELNEEKAVKFAQNGHKIFHMLENCPKPVVAVVNGFALGGGCELAMACHMRIATENAKFGQPEVNLGIIPGYGGTQRLPQLVGRGKALELMLTGDPISAEEAKNIGLVNHVVKSKDDALALAESLLNKIITKGPVAIAHVIKSVNAGYAYENAGYNMEANLFGSCTTTNDFREGTTAFIEKRKPMFKGN